MEAVKQKRDCIRKTFHQKADELETLLRDSKPDVAKLAIILEQLSKKYEQLKDLDKKLLDLLQKAKCTQDDFENEFQAVEQSGDYMIELEMRCKKLLEAEQMSQVLQSASSDVSTHKMSHCRLPEIELRKFGGDPREWIGFWTQFEKIHEDPKLDARDKFQYLIQSTVPNSKPRFIVESFPATSTNYPKAVEYLKDRFGKESTLIQVYVRDLLRLVINGERKRTDLSVLYDSLHTKLNALHSLGLKQEKYSEMLFPLVESCLPSEVLKNWERNNLSTEITGKSDLDSLMHFLKIEVESEQRFNLARNNFEPEKLNKKYERRSEAFSPLETASELLSTNENIVIDNNVNKKCAKKFDSCIFCTKMHFSQDCYEAANMPLDVKKNIIKNKNACFVCLKINCRATRCKSKHKCLICKRRHFPVLCPELPVVEVDKPPVSVKENTTNTLNNQTNFSDVLLQTLIVKLCNGNKEMFIRGILDSGSQKSYICSDVAEMMNFNSLREVKLRQSLFGGVETVESIHNVYLITLSSLNTNYKCKFEVLSQPRICSKIKQIPAGPWINELKARGIKVSDLEENLLNVDPEIKLLIGSDIVGKLYDGQIIPLKSGPIAIGTHLGFTLMGKTVGTQPIESSASVYISSLLVKERCISELWKLDTLGICEPTQNKSKLELEEDTMKYFNETISKDTEGRYEVALPWVVHNSLLPDNRNLAEKCLRNTKRKVTSSGTLEAYSEVFNKWMSLNIIENVSDENKEEVHYLAHRPVIKQESTTKIRPVFNASARVSGSPSLNDCLATGPNLIEVIPTVLNRFRKNFVGVISDIEGAFLQVSIRKQDRDFLRFLWFSEDEQIKIYRHRRVVFGITSSPFLLAATLNYHLSGVYDNLSQTANILRESFYVDNSVISLNSVEEMNKFILESQVIMSAGHFNLRGWMSNLTSEVIDETASQDKCVPVLGLVWDTESDTLSCKLDRAINPVEPITKRYVLAVAHQVFDTIGYTSPVMLIPKLILQETWNLKLKWDEILPDKLAKRFKVWQQQLYLLAEIKIPRWLNIKNVNESLSLHVFSDASSRSYGTCVFLRVQCNDSVTVRLIHARSRVAPLKPMTIPRLELLACCIGARLLSSIIKDLNLKKVNIFCWTDSTTALCWIRREQNWGIFVYNRVREIRSLTDPEQWHHVAGIHNPADVSSRGCSAEQLVERKWWEGPNWLYEKEESWPKSEENPNENLVNSEKRKTIITTLNKTVDDNWYFKYFSSYKKIVRMLAWIFRFYNKLRKANCNDSIDLSISEIEKAEIALMILIQKESFQGLGDEKIRKLRPILDSHGIIRVKTNIIFRNDTEDFRYPIILPSKHPVVKLLIMNTHIELLHAGTSLLMSHLREKYWILKSRKTIRNCIRSCVKCQRFKASKCEAIPGVLPEYRVRDAAVFEIVGVDLAGPLHLKTGQKSYIVLYTCAVYRAVHLELVTLLSTEAFLQSLRRFIARRGRPSVIYSDNGTNFVGANRLLSNIDWDSVNSKAVELKIKWKFNPPSAPWWGGWWERLVQMVKQMLRKVLGRASLNYEELLTLLCDCEQVINSRPLTYVSEDVDDVSPLTPAMFLHEIPLSGVPDIDTVDREGLSKRAKYLQKIRELLRSRFRSEYLGQLRQQSLKDHRLKPISVGEIVVVEEANKRRALWSLARVLKLFPGKDGHVRLALVKTDSAELLRPVQRLYRLELDSPASDTNEQSIDDKTQFKTRSGIIVKSPVRL